MMNHRLSGAALTVATTIAGSILVACGAPPVLPTGADPSRVELAARHVSAEVELPVPDATELTLEQLLAYADANAPAIVAARAHAEISTADVVEAGIRVPENPEIRFGVGGRTVAGATGFEFEVAVEQRLEVAREPAYRLAAANRWQDLAAALVDEIRWSVHVEVHRLFVDILLVQERRAQAARFVEFSESLLHVAERQVEAGESAPLVLLVARADLEHTRDAVIEAEQIDGALRARLAAVIGWPHAAIPDIDGVLPEVLPPPEMAILEARLLARHPALRSRDLDVVAAQSQLELERRESRVEPTFGVAYGREAAPGPESEANIWMLSVGIPIPAFRSNQAGQVRAAAELDAASAERAMTERALLGQLHEATVALDAAARRVGVYDTGVVPTLEENLQLLQRAYELGEVDIHVLSQTRERLLEATANFIDARVLYFETVAALEGLVGDDPWSSGEEIQ